MPQFMTDGRSHFVSYVTGPQHVMLGVEFGAPQGAAPTVIKSPPIGDCSHGTIDERQLVEAVLAGVNEESAKANFHHSVRTITYIENDSPNYSLFQYCAVLLVRALAAGTKFVPRQSQ